MSKIAVVQKNWNLFILYKSAFFCTFSFSFFFNGRACLQICNYFSYHSLRCTEKWLNAVFPVIHWFDFLRKPVDAASLWFDSERGLRTLGTERKFVCIWIQNKDIACQNFKNFLKKFGAISFYLLFLDCFIERFSQKPAKAPFQVLKQTSGSFRIILLIRDRQLSSNSFLKHASWLLKFWGIFLNNLKSGLLKISKVFHVCFRG